MKREEEEIKIDMYCKDLFIKIEEIRYELEQAGATNVSGYIKKLRDNRNNKEVFNNLVFEYRAAMTFLMNGFSVEMREMPDFRIKFADSQFYAEVKHFLEKEQDRIDQAKMKMSKDKLVPIGNTVPLEGRDAWDQVADVVKRKTKQYHESEPYILVIGSSSANCIDDAIMPTAINIINEEVLKGHYPNLVKLNGIMLISRDFNIRSKRNVYFFQTHKGVASFKQSIIDALHSIKVSYR